MNSNLGGLIYLSIALAILIPACDQERETVLIHGVIDAHNCEDVDLDYTVGLKPGLPVGGDFWETSSWIADQSYTIHPGEPRNWAQFAGRDFSLPLAEDEYEKEALPRSSGEYLL
jgi:hypothetical protein